MLFRAIALSFALLVGGAAIIPLATENAEADTSNPRKKKKRNWRGVKKYSKRWWQLYRAQERRKKLRAKQQRALRLRTLRVAQTAPDETARVESMATATVRKPDRAPQPVLPSGDPAPSGWRPATVSPSEIRFRVDNSQGDQVGSASISVVGPALMPGDNNQRKSVGGVATTALRRDVIDRMIRENGWVVNDYQKEISGQQVYVVVAQSQARNGQLQSRMFYFTEVDGKIYSVATNSPVHEAERLADESEKVINSLKSRVRPTHRASN
jgi:hypothetical protein